jgi:hypothetical protein
MMYDKIRALTNADESTLWTILMYVAHESSVETVRSHPDLKIQHDRVRKQGIDRLAAKLLSLDIDPSG